MWFFELRTEQNQFVVEDIPSYLKRDAAHRRHQLGTWGLHRRVHFCLARSSSATACIRACALASRTSRASNEWGDVVSTQRAFASRVTFQMLVENKQLDNTTAC